MLEIRQDADGTVHLEGILDSLQVEHASKFFGAIVKSCTVDLAKLDFISSAGLGLFLATQKRLLQSGDKMKLKNPTPTVRKILGLARFNILFDIDDQSATLQGPFKKNG